jgi:FtsZ-interacting cell division protein YlmF
MVLIYGLSSSSDPENIRYIGKAIDIKKRLKRHLSSYELKRDTHKNRWIKLELLNGNDIISTELYRFENENWQNVEIEWIDKYKKLGYKLTNSTIGGNGSLLTNEQIKKRSEDIVKKNLKDKKDEIEKYNIRKELEIWVGERICPSCGKEVKHTSKTMCNLIHLFRKSINRECLVCRSTGRKLSQETRDKISKSKENISQETREKLSKIHRGKVLSKETKDKLRNYNLGKKQSSETINKRVNKQKVKIICLNNNKKYDSIKEACEELNCSSASIIRVLKKEIENTKGYKFIYDGKEKSTFGYPA